MESGRWLEAGPAQSFAAAVGRRPSRATSSRHLCDDFRAAAISGYRAQGSNKHVQSGGVWRNHTPEWRQGNIERRMSDFPGEVEG